MKKINGLEGANGTTVTAANTNGNGTVLDNATAGMQYATSQKHGGSTALAFTDTAQAAYVSWTTTDVNIAMRAYFRFGAANSGGNFNLLTVTNAAGNELVTLRVNAANSIRMYSNVTPATPWAPTFTMPIGQWVRVELLFEQGTSSTTGRLRAALYADNSNTPLADSGWLAGLNLGGGAAVPQRARYGKGATGSVGPGVFMDDLAIATGADYAAAFIGPVPSTHTGAYRWTGTAYVPMVPYWWTGSGYVRLDTPAV